MQNLNIKNNLNAYDADFQKAVERTLHTNLSDFISQSPLYQDLVSAKFEIDNDVQKKLNLYKITLFEELDKKKPFI